MKSISIYRLNAIFLLLILISVIFYYGKEFLVPLFFSILFAMLLLPVCNKLEKWGFSRIMSTLTGLLIILAFLGAVIGIIAAQWKGMAEDLPQMQEKATQLMESGHKWVQENLGMTKQEQETKMQQGLKKMQDSSSGVAKKTLSSIMGLLTGFVLFMLYFFFLMWKREKYREFLLKLVDDPNRNKVGKELDEITHVAGQYLVGRLISMAFLAIIYMIGFTVVGLPNGLIVALVAVIPTIIPYVGAFVGGFFPLAIAIVSGTPEMLLPVTAILVVAQVIDNNIIEPFAEGESLHMSPIFTIIAIVLGELVWGVAGMILFIPLFAILKIICDHIPSLHPFSFLLANEIDEPKWVAKMKELFTRKKK